MSGSGTSTDILEASALAWLDIANRMLRRRAPAATGDAAAEDTAAQAASAALSAIA
jgi:2-isopropylmalate synthase